MSGEGLNANGLQEGVRVCELEIDECGDSTSAILFWTGKNVLTGMKSFVKWV